MFDSPSYYSGTCGEGKEEAVHLDKLEDLAKSYCAMCNLPHIQNKVQKKQS